MAANPGPLVLLTGGNGHIGFRVLVHLLKAGYRVRAAVRNSSREDLIRDSASIRAIDPTKEALAFVVIPDLLVDGAYDTAVQDVDFVIHVSGPISKQTAPEEYQSKLIDPSVKGTMNMLYACQKSETVRRVVLTSSILALISWADWSVNDTSDTTFNEKSRVEDVKGPFSFEWEAYSAGKVNSFNQTERWVRAEKPRFDVINAHPAIVIGAHELATSKEQLMESTSQMILMPVSGHTVPIASPGCAVHVDDVAAMMVKALDVERVKVNGDGLLSLIAQYNLPNGVVWDDCIPVVKNMYPELVMKGVLPCSGSMPTKPFHLDANESERILELKFEKSYEEQVASLMEQWVKMIT